eukprot:SAG22_NODE_5565_length_992_cov_0.895857_1_plen_48_part_10
MPIAQPLGVLAVWAVVSDDAMAQQSRQQSPRLSRKFCTMTSLRQCCAA